MPNIADRIMRNRHWLDQFGNGLHKQMSDELKEAQKMLLDELMRPGMDQLTRKHHKELLKTVTRILNDTYGEFPEIMENGMFVTAKHEYYDVANALRDATGRKRIPKTVKNSGLPTEAIKEIQTMPVGGSLLEDWVKKQYTNAETGIRSVFNQSLIRGLSMPRTAKLLKDRIGMSNREANVLARTGVMEASNRALDHVYKDHEDLIDGYEYLATLDNYTCVVCGPLDGKTKKKRGELEQPPLHPQCYDDQTEILTDQGFKLFKDLNKEENVFSLNPITKKIELMPPTEYLEYHCTGPIKQIKNKNFDLCITLDHDIYYVSDYDAKHKKEPQLKIKKPHQLGHGDRIPRTGKWDGMNDEKIYINGKQYGTALFMEFMGWYLSEGSVTNVKKRNNKYKYQIKISQSNQKNLAEINELLDKLFDKLWKGKEATYILNDSLAEYLIPLGKSYEKYVPTELKKLSSDFLQALLCSYSKGDGDFIDTREKNKGKGGKWDANFKSIKVFRTSSKKLMDDICELILKCGKRPSVSPKTKYDWIQFKNGKYKTKHNIWIITESHRKNYSFRKKDCNDVSYTGIVYCVELPKNHIVYVRRNGKCTWCGNCRCLISPVVELEGLDEARRFETVRDPATGKIIRKERISGKTRYPEWFDRQDEDFQRQVLGKTRFELYKQGKLKLSQMSDATTGRILTLKQLGEKYKLTEEITKGIEFIPAKTIEEAAKFAKEKLGIEEANFEGMHIKLVNEVNETMTEYANKYPILTKQVKYIGSGQENLYEQWKKDYIEETRIRQRKAIDPDMIKTLEQRARKDAEKYMKNIFAFSESEDVKFNGIGLNDKLFKRYDMLKHSLTENTKSGFHPKNCNTVKALIDHEMGHQLTEQINLIDSIQRKKYFDEFDILEKQNRINKKTIKELDKKYRMFGKELNDLFVDNDYKVIKKKISGYAQKNFDEFIAEGWSSYRNTKIPSDLTKQIGDLISEALEISEGRKK